MKFFILLVVFVSLSSLISCYRSQSVSTITQLDLPKGWSESNEVFKTAIAPEKDLKIYFHSEKLTEGFDLRKRSAILWKKINNGFNYKELQIINPPSKKWDKISQIVYQVPAEELKIVLTLMRVKGNIAYINLVESSSSTLNKRNSQMMQVIEAWSPKSIKEENFSKVQTKDFKHIEKSFEVFLKKAMHDLKIPGVSIGVVQGGEVVYQKGFGKTKNNTETPVDKNTLFMIGSITKPLTTLLMSKLIYDGKLKWDDPIRKNLKNWKLKDEKKSNNFLIKHSACACTGMPQRDLDFIFNIDGVTAEQRMKEMASMSPTSKLGETFQYSNYLVAAGGFSAARAYNKSLSLEKAYIKAMKDLVFNPLEMKSTFIKNSIPYKNNSAHPHSLDLNLNSQLISNKIEEFAYSVAPAGAIWSNSTDMLKYIQFELNKGKNIPNYIDEKNLLVRRTKGVKIAKNTFYGLGFMVSKYKGIKVVEHGGNTLGFTSNMLFLPEINLGIIILVNLGSANGFIQVLKGKLFELIYGMDTKANESLEFYKNEAEKRVSKVKELLKKNIDKPNELVGRYESQELGVLVVKNRNNKLEADFGEFVSELREMKNQGEKRIFLLFSPPWNGSLSLLQDKNRLIIDAAQEKYFFDKK